MRAYLDHASATRLRPAARDAMLPWLGSAGDPGRVHSEGRAARVALEQAREVVAAFFGARPREVVFTSGATEALNTAVFGAAARAVEAGGEATVVATAVERSAILESASRAGRLTLVGVDQVGRVDADTVKAALTPRTSLACVQTANGEVGTLQPALEVVSTCREAGILTLVDATASCGHLPFSFADSGADLAAVSSMAVGGPGGIGALLVRRGLRLPPLLVGGAQERARRAGLENVAAACGFAAAVAELGDGKRLLREGDVARRLTGRVVDEVPAHLDDVSVFGDPVGRVPHIVCLGVGGVEAEPVLLGLDQRGVAVHSGSSCSTETFEPSPVLKAMGVDADHSLRVSVGWASTGADVDAFIAALPEVVGRLRSLRTR